MIFLDFFFCKLKGTFALKRQYFVSQRHFENSIIPNKFIWIFPFISLFFSVIPDMQSFYPGDYHTSNHLAPVMNSSALLPSSGTSPSNAITNSSSCLTKFNDIDPINSSYPTYNNWSNGYNNYQYQPAAAIQTPAQAQYATAPPPPPPPHGAPTMLIYPQVYSTVNQNQIHLHLHGSEKIEQYLGANEGDAAINGSRHSNTSLGIGLSGNGESANVIMENTETDGHQHRAELETANRTDQEVGDPSSVWRPY